MMQSVQRRFGRTHTADESQVSVLLKDFEEADKVLQKVRIAFFAVGFCEPVSLTFN